jgi:glyoxylase-like metal-dependent hydrolase (beta-lactamase superfamily II)
MNVYFIVDDGRVTVFECGIKAMSKQILQTGETFGGIDRVVLSHAHVDHRGAAPHVHSPVYCHADDKADAEGDGGLHYADASKLEFPPARFVLPRLLHQWDGGPVQIAGTVAEGDDVAGFSVVHMPGHSPGQIALFRERDHLALTGDVFYTLNIQTSLKSGPRLPHHAFNWDTNLARESLLRLASMKPAAGWPGHANPVRGDVKTVLEDAARE